MKVKAELKKYICERKGQKGKDVTGRALELCLQDIGVSAFIPESLSIAYLSFSLFLQLSL